MNKIIFLGLLLLSILNSYSQVYNKLLGNNTEWHYLVETLFPPITNTIYVNGDSIISGYSYQKVYHNNELMLMYEDTLSQKVYWYSRTDSFSPIHPYMGCFSGTPYGELLYDFSLQLGDSTCVTHLNQQPISKWYKVDSLSYIQTLNGQRKRLLLKSVLPPYRWIEWIEGVGNIENLLNYKLYELSGIYDAPNYTLTCIYRNNSQIYQNPQYSNCENAVSIFGEPVNYKKIDIYPNPIENELFISSSEINLKNITLKMYNSVGVEIENYLSYKDSKVLMINTSLMQAGMYYYSIRGNDNLFYDSGVLMKK